MKKSLKSILALTLALVMIVGLVACSNDSSSTPAPAAGSGTSEPSDDAPNASDGLIHVSMYYADNPTLPWKDDWLAAQKTAEICGLELEVEAIPSAELVTKVSLALNTQQNCPDVILYQTTKGENASLALNGAIVPISDYADWTPNFNAYVEKFGMQEEVDALALADGKRYYMPALTDTPFFDGGLIMREDYLKNKGFDDPKTFDDLYNILKAYKEDYPDSYPLTHLVAPYVTNRMTMTSWGVSFGKSSSSGTGALSWDYEKGEYFTGAISDQAREFLKYMRKLADEGLMDPDIGSGGTIDGDVWSNKMATGAAMATYAYYDQIGGVEAASEIEGFKLQMYPSLEGPAGAHHQPKSRTGAGIMFPTATSKRDDFEQIVRAIDEMFYSEECAKIWCLGVEGETYTMDGDTIVYSDEIQNAPDGIYKYMQVKYGCGADPVQQVWILDQELSKYDENYAEINAKVAEMGDVIQAIPPTPLFDDMTAEEAATLQTPLADQIWIWMDAFVYSGVNGASEADGVGLRDPNNDADWEAYVQTMKDLQIDEFCQMYNDNLPK